ncbi:hypothetical protein [Nonlabens marinus]|uniref:Lipoprotein n=1 Tax=Nonlabens marinus S1-08 TaxID=1454201 RepID=W8VQ73_9FLAO|nr:hypothetical protein [Nonlabens marinus]BAO54900.1 hypothetical protein NMS_0891 [Nonlabens marinus S1-08]
MKQFLLFTALATILLFTSCKEDTNQPLATETELSTESATTDQGSSTSKNNTTTADKDPKRNVQAGQLLESERIAKEVETKNYVTAVLTPTSINLFEKNGKQDILMFGQSDAVVLTKMKKYLGDYSTDKMEDNCNGKRVRIVRWEEYINLVFVERNGQSQFAGWNLQSRDDNATQFKMSSGLTVGVKRTDLSTPMSQKADKTSLGYLQRPDSVTAILTSPDADATVTYLFSGVNCYALETGVKPESEKN